MAFDEVSELIDDVLQSRVVELVEDAQVLHSVPLHAPLLIARGVRHFDCLWNEGALKIKVLFLNDIYKLLEGLVLDHTSLELLLKCSGLLLTLSTEDGLCCFNRFHCCDLLDICISRSDLSLVCLRLLAC